MCVRQEAAEVALDGGPSPSPRFALICRPPALHIMYPNLSKGTSSWVSNWKFKVYSVFESFEDNAA